MNTQLHARIAALAVTLVVTTAGLEAQELRPQYRPSWADVPSTHTIQLDYNQGLTPSQNGAVLRQAVQGLVAGDHLLVGTGVWSIEQIFFIDVRGTSAAPIRIEGKRGATLTRSNASQNVVNIGPNGGGGTQFLALVGFEIRGGSYGVRLRDCNDVWVDRCHIHHIGGVGLDTNTTDTERITVTRCEIDHTSGSGEGMYLGGNNGYVVCKDAVVAMNHIHHTYGSNGDGIELKQGSHGCLIAENVIHDTGYPGILVYGTGGQPQNRIDGNIVWNSNTNPFQVQGEAIVTNNVVFARTSSALQSGPHQADTTRLVVVNNTFIAETGTAARLNAWANKPGMVLANNVFYSLGGNAVVAPQGTAGAQVGGNVVYGPVTGLPASAYTNGNGLSDFVDLRWDGSRRDARPTGMSALNRPTIAVPYAATDLNGAVRPVAGSGSGEPKIGALEPGTYGRYLGSMDSGAPRLRMRFPVSAAPGPFTMRLEGVPAQRLAFVWPVPVSYAQTQAGTAPIIDTRGRLQMGVADGSGKLLTSWPTSALLPFIGGQIEFDAGYLDPSSPTGVRLARRMLLTLE